jgi:hypothetical protein
MTKRVFKYNCVKPQYADEFDSYAEIYKIIEMVCPCCNKPFEYIDFGNGTRMIRPTQKRGLI